MYHTKRHNELHIVGVHIVRSGVEVRVALETRSSHRPTRGALREGEWSLPIRPKNSTYERKCVQCNLPAYSGVETSVIENAPLRAFSIIGVPILWYQSLAYKFSVEVLL